MNRIAVAVVLAASAVTGCSTHDSAQDDAWATVGIGSVFVSRSVTRMDKPFEHVTETTLKQTLVGRDAAEAAVRIEMTEGSATSTHDVKLPLHQEIVQPHDGSKVASVEETCTVPAGTFQCTRTTIEMIDGGATRSNVTWRSKKFPVPLRTIVTNDNMTVTTELTSVAVTE